MGKYLFAKAKRIDETLVSDDWPTRLDCRQITNIHFNDSPDDKKTVLKLLLDAIKSGQLAFDNIGADYSWNWPSVAISGLAVAGFAGSEAWANFQRQSQAERDLRRCAAHTPDNGWIAFLDGVGSYGSKALERHACGCTAICTVEIVFNNGLPRRWGVEGMHDDGLNISFTCHAKPLLADRKDSFVNA